MISDSQTECVCNHLTHFAVLMDFTDTGANWKDETHSSGEHDKILTILTQVGMTLSLTGVVLTVVSYFQLTDRHSPLCHIWVSLTSCIGAGHVVFFAGIEATENQAVCVAGCLSKIFGMLGVVGITQLAEPEARPVWWADVCRHTVCFHEALISAVIIELCIYLLTW